LYADDLMLSAESDAELSEKTVNWKVGMELKCLQMNMFDCLCQEHWKAQLVAAVWHARVKADLESFLLRCSG